MLQEARARLLSVADDIFTLRGKVAPRAKDIAYLASNPNLEEKVVKYRLEYLANGMLAVALSAAKTWGAFNLGQGGEVSYASGRIGQAAKEVYWHPRKFGWYESVYGPMQQGFMTIPPEIRDKMEEYLISHGVPENRSNSDNITYIVHQARESLATVDLLANLALPIVNLMAAGDKVPLLAKFLIGAASYTGLLLGPGMAKEYSQSNFEWNVTQTVTKTSREANGLGRKRWQIGKDWLSDNLKRFARYYQREQILFNMNDVLSGVAVLLKRTGAFGLVNMIDGALGGFSGMYNSLSGLDVEKRNALIIKLAREFCEGSIYLPTEGSWDVYREKKLKESVGTMPDSEVCRFVGFQAQIKDRIGTEINGSLSRGKVHLVEGASGEGKTVFLYALRGLVESEGNVYFNDGSESKSIYSFDHDELKRRVIYYSPDDARGKGYRVVDMYADEFLHLNPDAASKTWIGRALSVDDALLERWLDGQTDNSWESGAFDKLSLQERDQVRELRLKRIALVDSRARSLGRNMENIDAMKPMAELSSGMRERIMLDRVLLALDKGIDVLVLDEPLGRVDPDTARHLISEICRRLAMVPADKRPAIVLVSNVHKLEIREEVEKILGKDGLSILDVRKKDQESLTKAK